MSGPDVKEKRPTTPRVDVAPANVNVADDASPLRETRTRSGRKYRFGV